MTNVEEILVRVARDYADRLGLRDFTVEVLAETPDSGDVLATSTVNPQRKHIGLRFCDRFEALPEEIQRHVLCHELVHAHLQDLADDLLRDIRDEIGGTAYRMLRARAERRIESVVDAVARFHAEFLPPIRWH
jgi:hypothetical protein